MTFFYHMYGTHIGSLLVYMRSDSALLLMKNITGDQGNLWRKDNVTFVSLDDFRVHIIATYSTGFLGDIAIDDVTFSSSCVFNNRKDNTYCSQARVTGCADGTREGFFNEQHVAGCKGTWAGLSSLRDPPTNVPCGNKFLDGSAVTCNVPADVCDVKNKWRVCGSTGKPSEITSSINSGVCATASYGRFSAGINHCRRDVCNIAHPQSDYGCTNYALQCDEPLCCGLECSKTGNCTGAFWPKRTQHTLLSEHKGCSSITSSDAGGVMCCYDPNYVPPVVTSGWCSQFFYL
ncbi:MAM and LDL-receptor class A domain-containing protein 2-like [Corticium candelabrum]|uniref:MAM and LDL-receptor class A domain-containing protein 2-like n=1 Tax=Corticium candelabrum TaxID=121492 RepID=UPI002E2542CF|nr:MAM and LDL-receptor class A domain-containing protein 2-like [Corticium candelabrum]